MKLLTVITFLSQLLAIEMFSQTLLTTDPHDDRFPRWSPDGREIVFESNRDGNWELYKMSKDGSGLIRITRDSADDRWPSWHPDGAKILFESNRNGFFELYTYDIKSGKTVPIYIDKLPGDIFVANYSPDGRSIAFSCKFNLYLVDQTGQNLRQLTFDSTRSIYPMWSPTSKNHHGEKIAFFSRRDTGNQTDEIYIYELKTATTKRLTHWPTHNFAPAWSHDGAYIICATSMENSRPELYAITLETASMQRLTYNDHGDTEPHGSPVDGTIVYACQQNGNYDICILDLDELMQEDP